MSSFIVAAKRTPFGAFGKSLKAMTATQRGCNDAVDDELRLLRGKLASLKKLSVYA